MPADLERYIIPSNPFRCGTCDARNINRLTAEVAYWKGYAETRVELARRTNEHAVKVQAENERLTAALRAAYDEVDLDAMDDNHELQRQLSKIANIARAALKEPRTDSEAATRALDEYLREGGVTLEELKDELKEPRT